MVVFAKSGTDKLPRTEDGGRDTSRFTEQSSHSTEPPVSKVRSPLLLCSFRDIVPPLLETSFLPSRYRSSKTGCDQPGGGGCHVFDATNAVCRDTSRPPPAGAF